MKNLFTIAIPTRNRDKYLIETIDSIINQDEFESVKIIVCNNSDIKNPILKQKYVNYKNIKYFENEELLSIDDNMIKVASYVDSKYFLWLGDDDFIADDGLSKILKIITSNDYDFILLNATMVSEQLDKKIGHTIDINHNEVFYEPKEFFAKHCFHMPFGTLIVKNELYDLVLDDNKRFRGTSHAYSGLVFDYLVKKYLQSHRVDILVVKDELIQLRQIEKSWKNNATKIMFKEIPEWFLLLNDYYTYEREKILTKYISNQFKIKNLLRHRIKSQLSFETFRDNTMYASIFQKIKYTLVGLIPMCKLKGKN